MTQLPKLYRLTEMGNITEWQISYSDSEIKLVYGQVDENPVEKVVAVKTTKKTNPKLEATKRWNEHVANGYSETVPLLETEPAEEPEAVEVPESVPVIPFDPHLLPPVNVTYIR